MLHRLPTGIIDADFWTALDRAVAGGFVALEGASATAVEQHTPSGTGGLARRTERRNVAAPGGRDRRHHHRQLGA